MNILHILQPFVNSFRQKQISKKFSRGGSIKKAMKNGWKHFLNRSEEFHTIKKNTKWSAMVEKRKNRLKPLNDNSIFN